MILVRSVMRSSNALQSRPLIVEVIVAHAVCNWMAHEYEGRSVTFDNLVVTFC